jgi:hypothetical protein
MRSRQVLKWPSHGGTECPILAETTSCPEDCMRGEQHGEEEHVVTF